MNIGKENEFIEFKKTLTEEKEAIISMSSILNKHSSGTLYFGVLNNGEVKGVQIDEDTLRHLSRDINLNIIPRCEYEILERHDGDGNTFIEVDFSGNHSPYSAYGRFYERFADEDRMIDQVRISEFFSKRNVDYSAWENEKSDITYSDLDLDLIQSKIDVGIEYNRIPKETTIDLFLAKEGLTKNNEINNACEALFSKLQPITTKLAVFASDTKLTFLKLEHFQGNIYESIDHAISFVKENLLWKIKITSSPTREEDCEIPGVAIREMIVNMYAHGQYKSNTMFEIDIFKNRVVFYNPGFFPFGFTPDDFIDGTEQPIKRNPKINDVLFKTKIIEAFGTGFERTFEVCNKANVLYRWENTKTGFRITFFRPLENKEVKKMSELEEKIYQLIKDNKFTSIKDAALLFDKSEKTIQRNLTSLKNRGLIEHVGSDSAGEWKIV